jgi:hypothetical protein
MKKNMGKIDRRIRAFVIAPLLVVVALFVGALFVGAGLHGIPFELRMCYIHMDPCVLVAITNIFHQTVRRLKAWLQHYVMRRGRRMSGRGTEKRRHRQEVVVTKESSRI